MKNRKYLKLFLGFMLYSASSIALAGQIGMVNTAIVFKNHPDFVKMDTKFKQDFQERQASIEEDLKMITEEEKILEDKIIHKKVRKALIEKDQQELNNKKALFEEKKSILNKEIADSLTAGREKILSDIKEKIEKYGRDNNYDRIDDSSKVIYVNPSLDLTEKIIQYIKDNQK